MLTPKIKACFYFSKELLILNGIFSLLIAGVGASAGYDFLPGLCLSLVTGGAFLSGYFFERQRSHQFYFFYNLGLSKRMLYGAALLLDILAAALLFFVKNFFR